MSSEFPPVSTPLSDDENYQGTGMSKTKFFRDAHKHGWGHHRHEHVVDTGDLETRRQIERDVRIEKTGETTPNIKLIKQIRQQVQSIELDPQVKGQDLEIQSAELEKRKKTALKMIEEALSNAKDYVVIIQALSSYKNANRDTADRAQWQAEVERQDLARRLKHNALIDSLRIVARYIRNNFGILSEKQLEKFIDEQEERGFEILEVKRVAFPEKMLCPDWVNYDQRESITEWAIQLTEELGAMDSK